MLSILLLTMMLIALVMAAMAVGVAMGRAPLKGSCGGQGGPECACTAFDRARCRLKGGPDPDPG